MIVFACQQQNILFDQWRQVHCLVFHELVEVVERGLSPGDVHVVRDQPVHYVVQLSGDRGHNVDHHFPAVTNRREEALELVPIEPPQGIPDDVPGHDVPNPGLVGRRAKGEVATEADADQGDAFQLGEVEHRGDGLLPFVGHVQARLQWGGPALGPQT